MLSKPRSRISAAAAARMRPSACGSRGRPRLRRTSGAGAVELDTALGAAVSADGGTRWRAVRGVVEAAVGRTDARSAEGPLPGAGESLTDASTMLLSTAEA